LPPASVSAGDPGRGAAASAADRRHQGDFITIVEQRVGRGKLVIPGQSNTSGHFAEPRVLGRIVLKDRFQAGAGGQLQLLLGAPDQIFKQTEKQDRDSHAESLL
jgi:hypothetical protein